MLLKYECSSLATQKPTLDRLTLLLGTAMGIFTMMLDGDGLLRHSAPPFMDKVRVSYRLLQTEVIWGLLSCVSMPLDPWLEKGHQDRMRGKDPQNSEVESRKSHPPYCREYFHTPQMGDPLPLWHSTEGNLHRAGPPPLKQSTVLVYVMCILF